MLTLFLSFYICLSVSITLNLRSLKSNLCKICPFVIILLEYKGKSSAKHDPSVQRWCHVVIMWILALSLNPYAKYDPCGIMVKSISSTFILKLYSLKIIIFLIYVQMDKKLGKIKTIVMIVFAILAILPLIFIRFPALTESKQVVVPWDTYRSMCIPQGTDNTATYQVINLFSK